MTTAQKKRLETQLWNIADSLRGKMHADEFRDYCLGFIFYKYLSERLENKANTILEQDPELGSFATLDRTTHPAEINAIREEVVKDLGYFLYPDELFSNLARRAQSAAEDRAEGFILEDLSTILRNIEQSTMGTESEDDFDNLFEDLDLTSSKLGRTEKAKNALIAKVLVHLDKIDFEIDKSDSDILGDAYEYLIGQFASGAGKKAGEFYTPKEVSTVLAKLVTMRKNIIASVYDPTCGSGSLLLRVKREVEEVGHFYGQEMNRTTYNLARMNMIMHGVHYRDFDIAQEDTLERPQHIGMRFEAIVANPPFSAKWSANPLFNTDDRFSHYGDLAPKSKADYAFIMHMLHHLAESGTMAVVVPHGVLFRGGSEGRIRQYIIETKNWLDAVIGLPANIFYGTSIPTCILVFKKCREHPRDVLFIDASQGFEKVTNQNYLRDEDIEAITSTYRSREARDKYSHVASREEIAENDYNLNIPRYVDTFEPEAPIDIHAVAQTIKQLDNEMLEIDATIQGFCDELGIDAPL